MKKKLLFLGFLVGIFAALMILPASASCVLCEQTWEQIDEFHCEERCECYYITCPTCGDESVLVYCNVTHSYKYENNPNKPYGYYITCSSCDLPRFLSEAHSGVNTQDPIIAPTCLSRGYTGGTCDQHKCYKYYDVRTNFTAATLEHSFVFTETVEAVCGSYGGDLYTCSGCGFMKLENPVEAPHTPIDSGTVTPPTCSEAGYTTHTCSNCDTIYTVDPVPATGHSYTSSITTPATCSSTGVKTYTCSNCSNSYTETIPKSDHSYSSTVVAPTCTVSGYTKYTCTVCSHSYNGNTTSATGHKNTTKVTAAATCTTAGSQTTTCSVCGNKSTSTIPATGHSYKSTTVVPDCTQGGYTVYTCSTCSDSYQGDQIAATGHKYQDVVTKPTCTKGGYTKHTCSVCQDTYTDVVTPATGHNYKDLVTAPTCTVRGYTDHTCTSCGDNYRDTFVAALGHTEERYGLDWKCTVCGRIRVVTTGIRAVGSILDGFQIFGVGFASGAVDLFDGMVMNGEELTTIASAAFALIGLALIGLIVYVVIRKFTKRR